MYYGSGADCLQHHHHFRVPLIPLLHRDFGSSFTRWKQVYFFWSPTEDYCVTVWWIWFVFVNYQVSVWSALSSVTGTFSLHQITPDTSDTDLIVDTHKSDSSDCDTTVFCSWSEEINVASDEWRMSQNLRGAGVAYNPQSNLPVTDKSTVGEMTGSTIGLHTKDKHLNKTPS